MDNKSFVDSIEKTIKENETNKEKLKEDLTLALKQLSTDTNMKFFLKYLKKICLWDECDLNINNEILIYKKGRRDIWSIIRSVLPRELKIYVEIDD